MEHPKVAEAAGVGVSDPISGQQIVAFVVTRNDVMLEEPGLREELAVALSEQVAHIIGNFARPRQVIFVRDLPKTRAGKIMRRLLRDVTEGHEPGDLTTLADPVVMEDIEDRLREWRQYEEP